MTSVAGNCRQGIGRVGGETNRTGFRGLWSLSQERIGLVVDGCVGL